MFFKLKTTKPGEESRPLVKCTQLFASEKALQTHLRKYHSAENIDLQEVNSSKSKPNPKLFCNSCKLFFASEEGLNSHVATVHNEALGIKCELCLQRFSTDFEIARHIKTVHSVNYPCSICPKMFQCNNDLEEHLYSDHMDFKTDDEQDDEHDDNEERDIKTEDAILGC